MRAAPNTVKGWLDTLSYLYYSFPVRPYSTNIGRSLLKEPKYYLYDWSMIEDEGARFENMVACHLLKSANFWTDIGKGTFELFYIRDKDGREVDFLMAKDDKPWLLVETKLSDSHQITKPLRYFQEQLQADYALQVVLNMPYEDRTAFVSKAPRVVPARTFLSQLV